MTILLVNHDRQQLNLWRESFRAWKIPCYCSREAFTALQMAQVEDISAVICRIDLPLISGSSLSKMLKKENPALQVVLMQPEGIEYSFSQPNMEKNWDIGPILLDEAGLQKAVGMLLLIEGSICRPENDNLYFPGPPDFKGIIGLSPHLLDIFSMIRKVNDQDVTVLIQGESGTGKELIARAIHHNSIRTDQAFVSVNCAAIPENLLESELFGHEKGAFTGAAGRVVGRFEQANHGCIFMDEIGDMSPATQAKVLRIFEGHTFERVGGRDKISVDVRIIAATNRDLEGRVFEGAFREDLYYRLNAFPLNLPPLRERMEDVPLLTAHIIREFNRTATRGIKSITLKAVLKLLDYHWPGNIRHLENVIRRASILAEDGIIDAEHVVPERRRTEMMEKANNGEEKQPSGPVEEPSSNVVSLRSLSEIEKEAIETTLNHTLMNVSQASRILGITRMTLYKKAKEYGIQISR